MTLPHSDFDKVIMVALDRFSQASRSVLWDYAKQEKLSPIQIQFLVFLAGHPDERSYVTEIAREFNLTPATVSDAIRVLEKKGLLSKAVSPDDGRKFWLKLTGAGKELTHNLTNWNQVLMNHFSRFSPETKEAVMVFLLELLESLRADRVLPEVKTCFSCKFFQKDVHSGQKEKHHCLLRDVSLDNLDLQIDCPNYQTKNKS